MAKKAFIAILFLIAISGIAPPTHATATIVKARKLVEKFQDQTLVEEVMIKLPQQVIVPNGVICNPPQFDECDSDCFCFSPPPFTGSGICACPVIPRKMVGKFQDETVEKEKLIKLPHRVGTPFGRGCSTVDDTCDPGCTCRPTSGTLGVCDGDCWP